MKNLKKILSLVVAITILISTPLTCYADQKDNSNKPVKVEFEKKQKQNNGKGNEQKNKEKEEKERQEEEKLEDAIEKDLEETEDDNETEVNGKGKNKDWKIARDKYKDAKKQLKESDEEIDAQYDDLINQMEMAEDSEDTKLLEQLKTQIDELTNKETSLKEKRKELQFYMVEATRNKYSVEELEAIYEIGKELEKNEEEVEVIPVENVIIEDGEIKFSAPPIVKDGRTLIPVRNLVEGFGATVEWVSQEQEVNISKDDIIITLQIDSNQATVNGQAVEIDVPAELYDGRTYVPLRFIVTVPGT